MGIIDFYIFEVPIQTELGLGKVTIATDICDRIEKILESLGATWSMSDSFCAEAFDIYRLAVRAKLWSWDHWFRSLALCASGSTVDFLGVFFFCFPLVLLRLVSFVFFSFGNIQ